MTEHYPYNPKRCPRDLEYNKNANGQCVDCIIEDCIEWAYYNENDA